MHTVNGSIKNHPSNKFADKQSATALSPSPYVKSPPIEASSTLSASLSSSFSSTSSSSPLRQHLVNSDALLTTPSSLSNDSSPAVTPRYHDHDYRDQVNLPLSSQSVLYAAYPPSHQAPFDVSVDAYQPHRRSYPPPPQIQSQPQYHHQVQHEKMIHLQHQQHQSLDYPNASSLSNVPHFTPQPLG